MEKTQTKTQRKLLLTWLIIPFLLLWMTTNYVVGIFRPAAWQNQTVTTELPVQRVRTLVPPPPATPLTTNENGAVTLWFDDGWISQYTIAYPLLEKYSYKAALAVPTRIIGNNGYMGWAQVERLQERGWEITSHTRKHDCTLFKENPDEVERELKGAADDLKQLGLKADQFVSPCGVNSPTMLKIAKKYYLSYRTSEPGFNAIPIDDSYNLVVQTMRSNVSIATVKSWLTYAKTHKKWLIIMFHQIGDPNSEYSITTSKLQAIMEAIKQENIPVVLPTQVLDSTTETATVSATISYEE